VSAVQYTVDNATDSTTGVTFHVTEDLRTSPAAVNASITGSTTQTATCTLVDPAPTAGTDLTCTFPAVTSVTKLDIVAS
jgi:hypothetical protein